MNCPLFEGSQIQIYSGNNAGVGGAAVIVRANCVRPNNGSLMQEALEILL
ncbi:MAG: hypothetical protein JXR56_06040 [Candidatus Cloacimonetes bacterium]|nr:hypothetical protein [Candidatus Cloacimonadota bacterium]